MVVVVVVVVRNNLQSGLGASQTQSTRRGFSGSPVKEERGGYNRNQSINEAINHGKPQSPSTCNATVLYSIALKTGRSDGCFE